MSRSPADLATMDAVVAALMGVMAFTATVGTSTLASTVAVAGGCPPVETPAHPAGYPPADAGVLPMLWDRWERIFRFVFRVGEGS
jgi:hypothetical protein